MEREIPHPSAQFFMGWEHTIEEMNQADREAEADDPDGEGGMILVWTCHLWPLMNYNVADARWKTGQTAEVELYALCGVRLRSYRQKLDGAPIEFGEHWLDSALNHNPGGVTGYADDDQPEMCPTCLDKWTDAPH